MELSDDQIIGAAIALAGALALVWKQLLAAQQATQKELRAQKEAVDIELVKCHDGHLETSRQMVEMSTKLGQLEGRQEGIKLLTDQVLDKIHDSIVERDAACGGADKPVSDPAHHHS